MNTDELIKNITGNAGPTAPLKPPGLRALFWLPVTGVSLAVALRLLGGIRHDVSAILQDPFFMLENALLLLAALAATLAAFRLCLPMGRVSKQIRGLVAFATLVWAGICLKTFLMSDSADLHNEIVQHTGLTHCLRDVLIMSAVPFAALLVMARRAAPVHFSYMGYTSLLAALSWAAVASRYLCPVDADGHVLLWHFLPVLVFGSFGLFLGRLFYRW